MIPNVSSIVANELKIFLWWNLDYAGDIIAFSPYLMNTTQWNLIKIR